MGSLPPLVLSRVSSHQAGPASLSPGDTLQGPGSPRPPGAGPGAPPAPGTEQEEGPAAAPSSEEDAAAAGVENVKSRTYSAELLARPRPEFPRGAPGASPGHGLRLEVRSPEKEEACGYIVTESE